MRRRAPPAREPTASITGAHVVHPLLERRQVVGRRRVGHARCRACRTGSAARTRPSRSQEPRRAAGFVPGELDVRDPARDVRRGRPARRRPPGRRCSRHPTSHNASGTMDRNYRCSGSGGDNRPTPVAQSQDMPDELRAGLRRAAGGLRGLGRAERRHQGGHGPAPLRAGDARRRAAAAVELLLPCARHRPARPLRRAGARDRRRPPRSRASTRSTWP